MTITEVAREWLSLSDLCTENSQLGEWTTAQRAHDDAQVARAEIVRRLTALPAAGANTGGNR